MELDDFKKTARKGYSLDPESIKKEDEMISGLIERYRADEKKNRKKAILWIGFLALLSVFYFSRIASSTGLMTTGMLLLGCGMVFGALYTWFISKPIPEECYSYPLVQFLELAENRLKYMKMKDILLVVPILILLGIGGGFVLTGSFMKYNANITVVVIIWIVFFLGLCIFGFWAGRKNWERDYGDLYRSISEMKNNLIK